jgi:16S rRNA (guanine527-N7)-methyltransferase
MQADPAHESAPTPTPVVAGDPAPDGDPAPVGASPPAGEVDPLAVAAVLFGDRLDLAQRYVDMLADTGVTHGLIGPKEGDRIWQRHVLNCAVLAELVEPGARLLDMGSGAGLPGIPLALARPDLEIVLLEPLARRVDWLRTVLAELDLPVNVVRGRAEDSMVRKQWSGADVVTARAVAPLARLCGWALPLLRPGGRLLAIKGASATDEVIRDREAVRGFGGSAPHVVQCGGTRVDPPTTVVVVERTVTRGGTRDARRARGRQG